MLTARSVIVTTIAVAVVSVAAAMFTLMRQGPGQSTLGKDSYGTRADGHRAVHDLLGALGYQVDRRLIPAAEASTNDATYVLWNPLDRFVQAEPAHLQVLSRWVRAGGRLVVAPGSESDSSQKPQCRRCSPSDGSTHVTISLLSELGLDNVTIAEVKRSDHERTRQDHSSISPTAGRCFE